MRQGFTLIELLVVVAVIGLVAGVALVQMRGSQAQARDSRRMADLAAVQKALEIYNVNNDIYPLSTPQYEIENAAWGGNWSGYLERVPKDPLSPKQEYIYVSEDGLNYQIYANFETEPPPQYACGGCGPDGTYNAGIAGGPGSVLTEFAFAPEEEPEPEPEEGPEPSPALAALVQGPHNWAISQRLAIPAMYSLWTSTIDPAQEGGSQEVQIRVKDGEADVTEVTATVTTDNISFTEELVLISGTARDGVWEGSWTVNDSYNRKFMITFAAEDANGNSSYVDFAIR